MLYMELSYSVVEMVDAVKDTVSANGLKSCYIRPIAFRGYGVMGLEPHPGTRQVTNHGMAVGHVPGRGRPHQGCRRGRELRGATWHQLDTSAVKATGQYLNSSFARIEANRHGYAEAILLNEEGKVC